MNSRISATLLGLALIVSLAAIWLRGPASTPATPTWDDAVAEARRGGYRLLTTEELRHLYQNGTPGLLLVDTRQDWEHRTGHIEGSVLFPMEPTAWARWTARGDLERLLGPDKDRPVVFY